MTEPVAADSIEAIVGVGRHWIHHWARAVSSERRVYILHSEVCLAARPDSLDTCPFSVALDRGIQMEDWELWQDMAIEVRILDGDLVPVFYDVYGTERDARYGLL